MHASFAGHSSMLHRFQSRGKPCTATTSISASTPRLCIVPTKTGSMGEMPPSTRRTDADSARMARPASVAIAPKACHLTPGLKCRGSRIVFKRA